MSHVYIVVATKDSEIERCESYAGAKAALGRGFQLAAEKAGNGRIDLFDSSPDEENMPDGSVRWVFMNTSKQSVMVVYRKIEESLLSAKDPMNILPSAPIPDGPYRSFSPLFMGVSMAESPSPSSPEIVNGVSGAIGPTADYPRVLQMTATGTCGVSVKRDDTPVLPPYDFMDRSLPVGWTVDGKPALMGDMLDNPLNVTDPSLLSDKQQIALVMARVRKSPKWRSSQPLLGFVYFQEDALRHLKEDTELGNDLKAGEILSLQSLRDDLVSGALKAV